MIKPISPTRLIRWAGLFTWACVGIPLVIAPFYFGEQLDLANYLVWLSAHLVFGAAFWLTSRSPQQTAGPGKLAVLALMTLSALAVSHASQSGLGGILVLVVSGVLPWALPVRAGMAWLVAQNVALAVVIGLLPDTSLLSAVLYWGLFLGFSSFAFVTSLVAQREADARVELRKLNSELRATRELLAESTRMAERVRIARELHDLVGHHLTALSLNLETASHLVDERSREYVDRAQSLARLLLSDVREVVGQIRRGDELDLTQALRSLVSDLPSPAVHLDMPEHFTVQDPQRAQVILRCVQEIITNTVRHSGAGNLWIKFDQGPDGLRVSARDDGRGAESVKPGHGLTGMGERLQHLGGRLSWESGRGKGFRLDAWLPLEEGT